MGGADHTSQPKIAKSKTRDEGLIIFKTWTGAGTVQADGRLALHHAHELLLPLVEGLLGARVEVPLHLERLDREGVVARRATLAAL